MFKKALALLLSTVISASLIACQNTGQSNSSGSDSETETSENTDSESSSAEGIGVVANDIASDEEALVDTYADKFEQLTYTDEETGLSITYNLYLPEGYDESTDYPMVCFIADSSCTGDDATTSLTQGLGGLVWATDEWQAANPSIVVVPTYPETILDDHGSYTTTEYVELTKRFIDYMTEEYSVDTNRIYGTGQSMGCMTTLILASEYPDLYAACMFVDGQWDISLLKGLEGQNFVYFAAEDDTNAYNGMQEVMSMYDEDSVDYTYEQWDGTWSVDELSEATTDMFSDDSSGAYFISWKTGTIEASSSMGGSGMSGAPSGNFSGPSDGETSGSFSGPADGEASGSFSGPSDGEASGSLSGPAGGESTDSESTESGEAASGAPSQSTDSSAYHMASFDYAYNCIAVMEWLFTQSK